MKERICLWRRNPTGSQEVLPRHPTKWMGTLFRREERRGFFTGGEGGHCQGSEGQRLGAFPRRTPGSDPSQGGLREPPPPPKAASQAASEPQQQKATPGEGLGLGQLAGPGVRERGSLPAGLFGGSQPFLAAGPSLTRHPQEGSAAGEELWGPGWGMQPGVLGGERQGCDMARGSLGASPGGQEQRWGGVRMLPERKRHLPRDTPPPRHPSLAD